MDMDIMKTLARAQGKTIEQVQASLIEAQEAEIRGEKLSLPTKHDYQQKQEIQAQLPMWGEPVRGVPNSVLRSALFTATKRGKRQYFERKK